MGNLEDTFKVMLGDEQERHRFYLEHPHLVGEFLAFVDKKYRAKMFQEFLFVLHENGTYWKNEDFFSLAPLVASGLTSDKVIQTVIESSGDIYRETYEVFRDKDMFDILELKVNPRAYIGDFFKGALLYSKKTVFEEIWQFSMSYHIEVEDILYEVPMKYYLDSVPDGETLLNELMDLPGTIDLEKFVEYFVRINGFPDEEDYYYDKIKTIYQDILDDYLGPFTIMEVNRERISNL